MRQMKKTVLWLLLWVSFLMIFAGCSARPEPKIRTVVKTNHTKQRVPSGLLLCPEIPEPPDGVTKQSEAMHYTVEVVGIAMECRGKLKKVGQLIEPN